MAVLVAVADEPLLAVVALPVAVAASLSSSDGLSVLTVNDLLVVSAADRDAVAVWSRAQAGCLLYCSLSEAAFRRL